MRFSARGEYGILALLELALNDGRQTPLQARTISRNQRIPLRFLEQVLSALKKAGLVESVRGSQGGYNLARNPEEISLADILEAIEGPIVATGCISAGADPCWHERELGYCIVKETREAVRSAVLEALNASTLQELCDRVRKNEQNKVLMYHI
jgi:Rrf2 family cysteine metabolism transcriptional repressor